jgi:hypothetical protein
VTAAPIAPDFSDELRKYKQKMADIEKALTWWDLSASLGAGENPVCVLRAIASIVRYDEPVPF